MAEKTTTTTELERIYTIPLRKTKDLVRSRRADLAIRDVKRFLTRHMKSDRIWLDQEVNHHLWAHGKFTIPSRIRVRATRFSDGVVEVTLPETTHTGSVRSEIAERREKAAESPVLKAPAAGEHEHAEGERPVTDVAGIGPATAEKLAKADVESLQDLAKADPSKVAEATGVTAEKAAQWQKEAKAALAGEAKQEESAAETKDESKAEEPKAKDDGKAKDAKAKDEPAKGGQA